jgi:hypothetical protein
VGFPIHRIVVAHAVLSLQLFYLMTLVGYIDISASANIREQSITLRHKNTRPRFQSGSSAATRQSNPIQCNQRRLGGMPPAMHLLKQRRSGHLAESAVYWGMARLAVVYRLPSPVSHSTRLYRRPDRSPAINQQTRPYGQEALFTSADYTIMLNIPLRCICMRASS